MIHWLLLYYTVEQFLPQYILEHSHQPKISVPVTIHNISFDSFSTYLHTSALHSLIILIFTYLSIFRFLINGIIPFWSSFSSFLHLLFLMLSSITALPMLEGQVQSIARKTEVLFLKTSLLRVNNGIQDKTNIRQTTHFVCFVQFVTMAYGIPLPTFWMGLSNSVK